MFKEIWNNVLCTIIYSLACGYHYVFKSLRRGPKLVEHDKIKVVVITGCDTGFGSLLSKTLSQDPKICVVSLCLTAQGVKELAALGIHSVQCNVTSDSDVANARRDLEELLQEKNAVLHALVNNAGIVSPGDFAFYNDLKTIQSVMDVNFFGQLRMTQALLPLFLRSSPIYGGRILNFSSVCGATASPGNSAYNASKFAVEAWSDSIRLELAMFNIKVVKVRPGQFGTSMPEEFYKRFLKNYEHSSQQVQDLYGGNAHAVKLRKAFKNASESPLIGEPNQAIDVLSAMIHRHQNKLEPYYWLGDDAKTLWKAMSNLPTNVSDSLWLAVTASSFPDVTTNLTAANRAAHGKH